MRAPTETLTGVQASDDRPTPPVPFPAASGKARRGDRIVTASGIVFWPLDPRPSEIYLGDIASALSKLCRFGGHLEGEQIYSVAQHSVLVAMNLPGPLQATGLMHDATEAYCVDVPRPIKKYLINYEVIEARLAEAIGDRFGIELCDLDPLVKVADERALMTEKRDLLVPPPFKWGDAEPWKARITPWSPADARKAFLGLAWKLGIK
jgi:uncharacterized protein